MSEEFFEALMDAPTQIRVKQILSLIPSFVGQFMQKLQHQYGEKHLTELQKEEVLGQEPDLAEMQPVDVDYKVPIISVKMEHRFMPGVLIDGGSGVNVLSEETCRELNITCWDPAPSQVKMAYQRRSNYWELSRIEKLRLGVSSLKLILWYCSLKSLLMHIL